VPEVRHHFTPPLCGFNVSIDRADIASSVVDVSEFANGLGASRLHGIAQREEPFDAHVEMKAELLVDIGTNLPSAPPRQSKEPLSAARHAGSNTLNTASA
jgi:hypothetical protein